MIKGKTNMSSPPQRDKRDIDGFLFVQQLSLVACDKIFEQSKKNPRVPHPEDRREACPGLPDFQKGTWGIHGLWPTQFTFDDGSGKTHKGSVNCDGKKKKIDINALLSTDTMQRLESIYFDVKNPDPCHFYDYQYIKHGTCATKIEDVNTPEKFFNKKVELFDRFNFNEILPKINVIPGHFYGIGELIDRIKKIIGKNCLITFTKNEGGSSFIHEITLFFDKSFNLIDIPLNIDWSAIVYYPESIDDIIRTRTEVPTSDSFIHLDSSQDNSKEKTNMDLSMIDVAAISACLFPILLLPSTNPISIWVRIFVVILLILLILLIIVFPKKNKTEMMKERKENLLGTIYMKYTKTCMC